MISEGFTSSPIFIAHDPYLTRYEKLAGARLSIILEQLDLGSPANLGYTKVTWLPDTIARVRFLVMEGVLEPIIVVKIEFQEGQSAPSIEPIEIETDPEDPQADYEPYLWVGIASINHKLGSAGKNVNCDFWGYPIEPHLYGLEPRFDFGIGAQSEYGFRNSAESLPGTIVIGSTWVDACNAHYGEAVGAGDQQSFQVNGGQDYELDAFLTQQGTFSDGAWRLTFAGIVNAAANSGMICTEHMDTNVTAPDEAYEGVVEPGALLPTSVDPGYWRRSIIVDPSGHEFPVGEFAQTITVGPGTASNSATYGGGVIPCFVVPGQYEIGAFAGSHVCECTTAVLHIRLVIGRPPGHVTVVDFFPEIPGSTPVEARFERFRDNILGGEPGPDSFCQNDPGNGEPLWGGNDGGPGFWDKSLFVNVGNGYWHLDAATRERPHFDTTCTPTSHIGPGDPLCAIFCDGVPVVQPAHNLDFGVLSYDVNASFKGVTGAFDLRFSVIWHMAVVTQINNDTKEICFIQLAGNDGADGGTCGSTGCEAFSYGTMMRAIGIDPGIPLGTDLRELENQGVVPYGLGERVTVIGFTDQHQVVCAPGISGGRLIVTRPNGAGQDFTHISWRELRCPGFQAVDTFFRRVEEDLAHRVLCIEGQPVLSSPVILNCGCSGGQWRCR